MALSDACEDVHRVDFSYPFLKGIDPSCPPSSIVVPPKYLDAMGNMERQYWEIKAKRYNVMIFFKKGKFYELYDYDAVIANREFGLKMVFDTTNRGKMRLAGVPEQSFSEWARLFVFRGYKVGRVEQLREDAAESSGAAKAKIVPRELVEVLTPGTLTDPAMLSDHREVFLLAVAAVSNTDARVVDAFAVDLSRHVVYWCPCGSPLDVERYREAVAAGRSTLQDATPTGAMSSAFNEDAANALTALLQRLNPKEIIIADTAAHTASASIAKWIESEGYRVETVTPMTAGSNSSSAITSSAARQVLTDYFRFLKLDRHVPLLDEAVQYVSHLKTENSSQQQQKSVAADELAQSSSELSWERRNDPGLVLDAATVSNLEIVANLQDGSEKHSLHTYLNQCVTNGGKRLFRSWMLRPASTARVIAARQDVVRYLVDTQLFIAWGESGATSSSQRLSSQLLGSDTTSPSSAATTQPGYSQGAGSTSPARKRPRASTGSFDNRFGNAVSVDFERNISRLAEIKMDAEHRISYVDPLVQYRKNLSIILTTVEAFIEMVEWSRQFEVMCEEQGSVVPALLREILASIRAAAPSVEVITGLFDRQAASETGLLTPAPGTSTEYDAAVERLTALEEKMHAIRGKIQAEHFHGATATFTDLGKDLFLLEVAAHDAPKMTPPGMVERARSSKSVKYCVDALAQLAEAHKAVTITKSNALLNVLQRVAGKICEHWSYLYTATSSLAYFDCLMNLARFHHRAAVKTFPIIADYAAAGTAVIRASDLVHPLLTCVSASSPVPNSVSLDAESGRLLLLTGPNMAGKSTLMRTVAVNVILAQLGGPCMGAAMMLSPVDRIFTRIGARDASHKGQSTLFVELNETAELLRCATGRSLCLVDELGRGTSTHDGLAIAHATLHALKGYAVPPLTLFSTHYHALAMEESRHANNNNNNEGDRAVGKVQLGYMNFALGEGASSTADEANNTTSAAGGGALPTITFLHKLVPGICDRSYGVEVALMAGIPPTLVHLARRKSAELAQRSASHEDVEAIRKFLK